MELSFSKLPEFIYSSYRQFDPDEHHINRYTDEFVLILMLNGTLRFEENGKPVVLNAGEYYIQRPLTQQTGNEKSDSPLYYYIHFYGELEDTNGLPLRGTFIENNVKPYIEELELVSSGNNKLEKTKCFYEILSVLATVETDSVAYTIKKHIVQNYKKNISLDKLCSAIGFSKNSIIRIFKKEYNTTPYHFLTEFRLEKARQYLITTNIPCEHIAAHVGFDAYQVFFKSFSKKFGVSPLHYRAQNQKNFYNND